VTAKPLLLGGVLVVPSDDGNLYAFNPATGTEEWQAQVGMTPNEVAGFGNEAVVSATNGTVDAFGAAGNLIWSADLNSTPYNASYVYGASANANEVYVSADSGIFAISDDGTVKIVTSFPSSLVTAPAAGPDYVVYGTGNTLYKMDDDGTVLWTAQIDGGSFYPPAAIDANGAVYAGALDGAVHAYSADGADLWQVMSRNWVMGTPLVYGGVAYFGSDDGGVYAVDAGSGQLIWQAQTQLAVQTEPEPGTMGGRNVIFVGGSDNNIYAIDRSSGEIVWKGSADAAVGNPLFYQGTGQSLVIFGSEDDNVYAYSTERACSITSPLDGSDLGRKEIDVEGSYVSAAGGASVWVNVDNAGWQQANISSDGWAYYIDPAASFGNSVINTIECKVVDSGGEESGNTYTTVSVNYDPTIPLSTLVVTASPNAVENKQFTIFVNDGDDGSPVDRFDLTVDGQSYSGDGNLNLTLPAGKYSLTVQKIGFNDATVDITVSSTGLNPLYIVGGVALILVIVWYAWSSFSSRRAAKSRG
jgi:outer membrane protein assembly factor BamB